tara:strand:- start:345 stop:2003 length:1659 start_codon:yes stop_codon:yes gene_type:complete
MGRYVGSSINKGSGGGSGGSGTIVQTDSFTRATGISTDANNHVTEVIIGDEGNKYSGIKYNTVGLITAYNETISDETKGWSLEYDSRNLCTSITEVSEWPSYSAAAASNAVNEGSSMVFTVTTSLVPDATTLYYDTNLADADFSGGTENGSFTITSGTGTFTVNLANDVATEGPETLNARIYTDAGRTDLVATSGSVTVSDTSAAPPMGGVIFHATTYNNQATHQWTVPTGVTAISVVCVGGGGAGETNHDGGSGGGGGLAYKNNISVTAGQTVTVKVGGGGFATSWGVTNAPDGQTSQVEYSGTTYAVANGGSGAEGNAGNGHYDNSNSFPNTNSDGGGRGGCGIHYGGCRMSGGGAGGYSGGGQTSSGYAGNNPYWGSAPADGQNGGGGGGTSANGSTNYYSAGGGGTGVYGQGSNGAHGDYTSSPSNSLSFCGKGGSTAYNTGLTGYSVNSSNTTFNCGSDLGNNYNRETQSNSHGQGTYSTPDGGFPGGGAGGANGGHPAGCGGHGCVRIIWGSIGGNPRAFPSTNVNRSDNYDASITESTVGTQKMY